MATVQSGGPGATAMKARVSRTLLPYRNVLSLAALPGSPYIVAGDSLGYLSAWYAGEDRIRKDEDCDFSLETHEGGVTSILVLGNHKLHDGLIDPAEEDGKDGGALALKQAEETAVVEAEPTTEVMGAAAAAEAQEAQKFGFCRRLWLRCTGRWRKTAPMPLDADGKIQRSLSKRSLQSTTKKKVKGKKKKPKTLKYWLVLSAGEDGFLRISHWRLDPIMINKLVVNGVVANFHVDFKAKFSADSQKPITAIHEVHDGHIAVALKDTHDIVIVDLISQNVTWRLFGHIGPVTALAECSDGRVVSGGKDGAVRLWKKMTAWAESGYGHERPVKVSSQPQSGEEDLEQPDPPGMGVCCNAFYAHMYNAEHQQGECLPVSLRILVKRVDNLPNPLIFGYPDRVVTCTVIEGQTDVTSVRTPSKGNARWESRIHVPLRKIVIDDEEVLPECLRLDFEILGESRLPGSKEETLLACWSISVEDVMYEIANQESPAPKVRPLRASLAEQHAQPLTDAKMTVGFENPKAAHKEGGIDCLVDGAIGLPLGVGQQSFVRIFARHTRSNDIRTVPARYVARTRVLRNSAVALFDEVLEVEVPANLNGKRLSYSPDLQLRVDVFDHDNSDKNDYLVATTTMPMARAVQSPDCALQSFELALGPGKKGTKKEKGKGGSSSDLRKAADASPASPSSTTSAPPPKIYLAFEAITRCPLQVRCSVDKASTLPPCSASASQPSVRVRMTPGNPLLSRLTTVQTSTKEQTLKPTWNERCVLQVPRWCQNVAKKPGHLRPTSVRHGWEHEGKAQPIYLCADVFHRGDDLVDDKLVVRACLPLDEALRRSGGDSRPQLMKPDYMTFNTEAQLFLGFEAGPGTDQLTVVVEKADKLPGVDDGGSCNPYCVVRICEYSLMKEPTDSVNVQSLEPVVTAKSVSPSPQNPAWYHEGLLDLPGATDKPGGIVAARPNWHVSIEVMETDPLGRRDVVLAQAAIPLTELLSDILEEEHGPPGAKIDSRVGKLKRADVCAVSVKPSGEPYRKSIELAREFQLVATGPTRRQALTDEDLKKAAAQYAGDAPTPKGILWRNRGPQISGAMIHQALLDIGQQITDSFSSALEVLGLGEDGHFLDRTKDPASMTEKQPSVAIRFEVIPRTLPTDEEARQGRTWPKPMLEPTPVTSLAAMLSSVAAGYESGHIYIWDTVGSSTAPLHQLQAYTVPVTGLCFYPKLDLLASAGSGRKSYEAAKESELRLWSCSTWDRKQAIPLHSGTTRCLRTVDLVDCQAPPCFVLAVDTRQKELLKLVTFDPGA